METAHTPTQLDVPPGQGRAVRLRAGDTVQVIDVDGAQVGDVFAFAAADTTEHLSASHTRTATGRLFPRIGEQFFQSHGIQAVPAISAHPPAKHDAANPKVRVGPRRSEA